MASLISKASLLMVPSTYEDGTLYNVLPSGNKAPDETGSHNGYDQTRADFTFSRGSNLAATRVNADGLIEKGRENLFKYSNQFDNAVWAGSATWTSGQADKDGGTDAWLFAKSTATSSDNYSESITGVQTFSIYVKKEANKGIAIYNFYASTNARVIYNVETGALLEQNANVIDSNLVAYNDEWWRLDMTANITSTGYWYLYATDGTSTLTTDTLILQNAQAEKGLVATDYIETGATTATAGVLENTPRIDYSSGAGALLLEGLRSNLVTYSEYITGFSTSNTGISIEENATTSPEGVVNAAKIKEDGTNAAHAVRQLTGPTLTSGTDYTFSFFAKKGERSIVALSNTIGASNDANCFFDLENGQVLTNTFNSASIEDFGNGWYRCIATDTADAADDYDTRIYTATADNQFTHQGVSGSGLFIYGAQLEAGSYASSYIPTYGSAASRSADSCYANDVSHAIGQTEGVIYAEIDSLQFKTGSYIGISDGTTTNRQIFGWESNGGDSGTLRTYGFWPTSYGTFNKGEKIKVALAYKANDFALYVNGTQAATNTTASVAGTLSKVGFHSVTPGSQNYQGNAYELALFNERLTNAELATLTTL